uniref:HAT C-terminal dimerisation domain-containing protein n=1 Tax=Timema shepardi TaxID=629360 RepID=A0A7R9FYP6_TIMSH|nr:unnamed protein product [Timema shepardi]
MDLSQPQSKTHQMSIEESFKRVTSYSEPGIQHNLLVKCLLYFICVDKQPFHVVNGRGFQRFIKQLSPSFKIPTMDTLKQELDDTYDLMVNIYKTKFGSDEMGHVALTSDNSVVQSDLLRSKQNASGIENPLKLILDVKTRWNSVYHMLERYIELSSIVHPILLQNPKAPLAPTAVELNSAKQLLNILKPVEYVTREVSGEKCATISKIIPLINCLRAQVMAVDETDSELVEVVKEALLKAIDDHFGNVEECHLVALACFLDPRFKNIHFSDPKAYANNISLLRRAINKDSSVSDTNSDSSTPTAYDFWSHHKVLAHGRHNNKRIALAGEREKDEIALYLANPVAPLYVDPLQQWEDMKHIFPSLYRQAQLYLLAPATSVPAERLFSEAGDTLTKTRNRLLGERMERLLFLSDCTEEDWQL